MNQYSVGPMPPQDFLDAFLPVLQLGPPSFSKGMFSEMGESDEKADMYPKFVCFRSPLPS